MEGVGNARSIIKVPTDPDNLQVFTPNHFILGSSNDESSFGVMEDHNLRYKKRKAQHIANEYWRSWIREHSPSLTKGNKWCNDSVPLGVPICVGDILFVLVGNSPRNKWKLNDDVTVSLSVTIVLLLMPRKNFKVTLNHCFYFIDVFRKICKSSIICIKFNFNIQIQRSALELMHMRNRIGPITDPCGAPKMSYFLNLL